MELTTEQLRDVYDTMIRPIGHPDPVGFMARALLLTGGDPDYVDVNGRQGFIPLDPERAIEEIGAIEVQSLQGNVSVALAMDIQYFEMFGTLDQMVAATHDGPDNADTPTPETKELVADLDEAKEDVHSLLFPRLATVEDVIRLLQDSETAKPSKTRMKFFKGLLNNGK